MNFYDRSARYFARSSVALESAILPLRTPFGRNFRVTSRRAGRAKIHIVKRYLLSAGSFAPRRRRTCERLSSTWPYSISLANTRPACLVRACMRTYLCAAEWFRNVEAEEDGVRGAHRSHRANLWLTRRLVISNGETQIAWVFLRSFIGCCRRGSPRESSLPGRRGKRNQGREWRNKLGPGRRKKVRRSKTIPLTELLLSPFFFFPRSGRVPPACLLVRYQLISINTEKTSCENKCNPINYNRTRAY